MRDLQIHDSSKFTFTGCKKVSHFLRVMLRRREDDFLCPMRIENGHLKAQKPRGHLFGFYLEEVLTTLSRTSSESGFSLYSYKNLSRYSLS